MGGPSSGPQPQNEVEMPPAAFSTGESLPGATDRPANTSPKFRAGARVFFDSNGVPVKGTVAKPNATGEHCMSSQHLRLAFSLHAGLLQFDSASGIEHSD